MTGARTVAKAADVLLCFSSERPVWRLSELSRTLGLSKTVVHRLLRTLQDKGFVVRSPTDGTFSPGAAGLRLAAAFLRGGDLIARSQDVMHDLWDRLGETVALSVRSGDHRVCVYQLESHYALRYTLPVGQPMVFYGGATGKLFLSAMTDEEIAEYVARIPGGRVAPRTLITAPELLAEAKVIRRRGYALGLDEGSPGGAGVAAPVLGSDGRVAAVISVLGPRSRLSRRRLHQIAPQVVEAARAISIRLGAPEAGQPSRPSLPRLPGSPRLRTSLQRRTR